MAVELATLHLRGPIEGALVAESIPSILCLLRHMPLGYIRML